jgi:hypothetical protein
MLAGRVPVGVRLSRGGQSSGSETSPPAGDQTSESAPQSSEPHVSVSQFQTICLKTLTAQPFFQDGAGELMLGCSRKGGLL